MENANSTVQNGSLDHLVPIHGENVADQHVFEVLSFPRGFAHGQDGSSRRYSVGNTDESFLRNMSPASTRERENSRPNEGEGQAKPIGPLSVGIHADEDRDGGAQCRNLSQRQINEDYAALHYVHAQVGVDSGQNQAGHKWPN